MSNSTVLSRSYNSSILVLGKPPRLGLNIDVDFAPTFSELVKGLRKGSLSVIVLPLLTSLSDEFINEIQQIKPINPALQIILIVSSKSEINDLKVAMDYFQHLKTIDSIDHPNFEKLLLQALEKAQLYKQNENLEKMVISQKSQLQSLHQELERRVRKRQAHIEEVKQNTLLSKLKWKTFSSSVELIQKSSSIPELESLLAKTLHENFDIIFVKIISHYQEEIFSRKPHIYDEFSIYKSPMYRGPEFDNLGYIYYFRHKNKPFAKDEMEFLEKISESVSLAIGRFQALRESETLKEQWDATFQAVSEVVILVNENYEILQSNKKFNQQNFNLKCFEILFNRDTPCKECQFGKNFKMTNSQKKYFEVYSNPIHLKSEELVFMNQYYDISERIAMENKIVESHKMAELGSIGSSIAHELNNPLGGIYSLLQLIQMDLPTNSPILEDINEMLLGVQRCRDIIENLLNFTRKSDFDEKQSVDLKKALERAIRIIEIQTKSRGIRINFEPPQDLYCISGSFNLLSQAFKDILQEILDRFLESDEIDNPSFFVKIRMKKDFRQYTILFSDNSPVQYDLSKEKSYILEKIIKDHGGKIEFYNDSSGKKVLSVIFPRVV